MVDNAFSPLSINVNVGDRIRWTNKGAFNHTTESLGNWKSGTLTPGDSFLLPVFESAETFSYFCKFHGEMTATVVVNE
jgi:plastocyanin